MRHPSRPDRARPQRSSLPETAATPTSTAPGSTERRSRTWISIGPRFEAIIEDFQGKLDDLEKTASAYLKRRMKAFDKAQKEAAEAKAIKDAAKLPAPPKQG